MLQQDGENKKENDRKKSIMKERDQLRNWDPGWENQTRVQIMEDPSLVVNWLNGRWNIDNQKFTAGVRYDGRNLVRSPGVGRCCSGTLHRPHSPFVDGQGEASTQPSQGVVPRDVGIRPSSPICIGREELLPASIAISVTPS